MDRIGLMFVVLKILMSWKKSKYYTYMSRKCTCLVNTVKMKSKFMIISLFWCSFIKAFLIISCLLLATTFVIYAAYSKNLLNFYTKIMMHYCACLFLSFFFLTVNKFHHLGASIHKVFCEFTGNSSSWSQIQMYNWLQKSLFIIIHRNCLIFLIGFLLQYLFVCSFTFMSTMAIETWMQLK